MQRAKVSVDGESIPDAPWYVCDLPVAADTAFRDVDYDIPARYTQGKTQIVIKLVHVRGLPDDSNNEYYYWANVGEGAIVGCLRGSGNARAGGMSLRTGCREPRAPAGQEHHRQHAEHSRNEAVWSKMMEKPQKPTKGKRRPLNTSLAHNVFFNGNDG
jgi:hypothetical protein